MQIGKASLVQMREMVNKFNKQVTSEGKTEVVHEGDPDGTLFLINPDVSPAPLRLPFTFHTNSVTTGGAHASQNAKRCCCLTVLTL